MKINIAINGYGRIGRCITRALYESKIFYDKINLLAINETADAKTIYHLTKYDSTHGRIPFDVKFEKSDLIIGNDHIKIFQEMDKNNNNNTIETNQENVPR